MWTPMRGPTSRARWLPSGGRRMSSVTDARRGARSERPPRAVTVGPLTRDASSATEAGTRARALLADSFSNDIVRHGVHQRKL